MGNKSDKLIGGTTDRDFLKYLRRTLPTTYIAPRIGGGLYFTFNSLTTSADPGSGKLKYNNATAASVTNLYISKFSQEGLDVSSIISGFTVGQKLLVRQENAPERSQLFTVSGAIVNNTTWYTVPVTFVSTGTGGVPQNNANLTIAKV